MRDIRHDLAERITLLQEEINGADTELERQIKSVKREHESKLKGLQAELDAVNILLELEYKRFGNAPSGPQSQEAPPQPAQPDQAQPRPRLLDILIRKLGDDGPTSSDDLRQWAVGQGYLEDSDAVRSALLQTLTETAKAGLIQQLPDGKFAATSITDLIRLRRTV